MSDASNPRSPSAPSRNGVDGDAMLAVWGRAIMVIFENTI